MHRGCGVQTCHSPVSAHRRHTVPAPTSKPTNYELSSCLYDHYRVLRTKYFTAYIEETFCSVCMYVPIYDIIHASYGCLVILYLPIIDTVTTILKQLPGPSKTSVLR